MKCNTRSGRMVREETRKERLTRPSNFIISPLSEGPILKCDFRLQRLARACKPTPLIQHPLILLQAIWSLIRENCCTCHSFCIK
jgi:hypothetical protein